MRHVAAAKSTQGDALSAHQKWHLPGSRKGYSFVSCSHHFRLCGPGSLGAGAISLLLQDIPMPHLWRNGHGLAQHCRSVFFVSTVVNGFLLFFFGFFFSFKLHFSLFLFISSPVFFGFSIFLYFFIVFLRFLVFLHRVFFYFFSTLVYFTQSTLLLYTFFDTRWSFFNTLRTF